MKLGRLDYCLSIKDINASFNFYSKLDFQIVEGKIEENWLVMEHGNLRLGLYQDGEGKTTLNFRGANINTVSKLLNDLNIEVERSKSFENGTGSINLKDPDGYNIFFDTHETELELGVTYEFDSDNIYPETPNLILGRTDLCLDVSNIQKSAEFYQNLGLRKVQGSIDENWIILSQGNLRLGLFEATSSNVTINFRGGDVEKIYNTLKSEGFEFKDHFNTEEDDSAGASLYDPDSNFIYFNTAPGERMY